MNDLDLTELDARLKALSRQAAASADLAAPEELRAMAAGASPRRTALVTALAGLAAAAAVAALVLVWPGGDDTGTQMPLGPPTTTVEPTPTPDAPATPTGTEFRVAENLTVTVPVGWKAEVLDSTDRPAVCLTPKEDPRGWREPNYYCGVEILTGLGVDRYYGGRSEGNGGYEPGAGWYTATDVHPCPAGDETAGPDGLNGLRPLASSESGLRPFGAKQANYNLYPNGCDDGYTFDVQAWYLPQSKILLVEYGDLDEETAQILASARFS